MFLSQKELVELTGRRRKDAQLKALRHMGIEHRVRADGSLAVLTAHIYKEFDGNTEKVQEYNRLEPNWGAI